MVLPILLLCICFQPQVDLLPYKYEAKDGAFSIHFPSKPEEREAESGTEEEKKRLIGYREQGKFGLALIIYDYPEGTVEQRGIEDLIGDVATGVGGEPGSKPKSVEIMKIGGFPSRSYTTDMPNSMEMLNRIVVVNDRVYVISVMRPNDGSLERITKEFFASFQVNSLPFVVNRLDYKARFPRIPELGVFKSDAEGAEHEIRSFANDEKTSCYFALSKYELTKGFVKEQGRDEILSAARKRLYESPKFSLQKYRSFMDGKHECLEVQAASEDEEAKVIARHYLVDDVMYRLLVFQSEAGKGDKITEDFFDSFRVVEKDPLPFKLEPEDESFTARFPASPKRETAADRLHDGIELPKVFWFAKSPDGQFLIEKTSFPEGFLAESRNESFASYKKELSDAYNGKIVKSESVKNGMFGGNNSVIESEEVRIFARFFAVKDHLYRVLVMTNKSEGAGDEDAEELVKAFLDSFKLKNPLPYVYRNKEADFSVNFPGKPKTTTFKFDDKDVEFPTCLTDGVRYQVIHSEFPEELNAVDKDTVLKAIREAIAKRVDGEVVSFELLDEHRFGQQVKVRNGQYEYDTLFCVKDHAEITLGTTRKIGKKADWREKLFFNSLTFGSK